MTYETKFYNVFYTDTKGIEHVRVLRYTIWKSLDGKIEDIRNSLGFSIERGSEIWDYFNNEI